MHIKLLDILCCPTCKGDLLFNSSKQDGEEVIEGNLYCRSCKFAYPITDGIPNLLPKQYHKNE